MEENSNGKRKTSPSIPDNYISILHLQERWINEKDQKRKEEEEKRRKQQVERTEDDLKKTEDARGQRDEEKRLNRSNRKNCGTKKKDTNGGDVKVVEKEEPEVTAAIGSERGEDTAAPEKILRGFRRKRYNSKKKKNQDVAVVDDVVIVDSGCGSIAPPPPEVVVTEKITPVKEKKGKKATGKKSVTVVTTTAIETQIEDLSIKKLETKNLKAQTKSSNRNRLNQGNDLVHHRVRMPIKASSASTMVWVKKEQV